AGQDQPLEVAAGQEPHSGVDGRRGDRIVLLELLGEGPRPAVIDQPAARYRRLLEPLHDQVVGDRQVRRAADPGPVLRDVGDAGPDRVAWRLVAHDLAADADRAAAAAEAGDHLGKLRLAVAGDRRDPDDLAGPDL